MHITSTAFQDNEAIPADHGYGHDNPPLTFSEVPVEAKSLALVVEDPDAPDGVFTHWLLYDMSPATLQILPGELPLNGRQATNDFDQTRYDGPKPPAGTHRYVFRVHALDTTLDNLLPTAKRPAFDAAIEGHSLAEARLTGRYTA